MNSRQRVLAALNHREPDRAPIDFGGHRSSGVMAVAYSKLKKLLGISSGDIFVYDMVQQLAIVEPPVLDALGVDVIEMGRGFLPNPEDWKDWTLPDGTPCKIPRYVNVEQRGGDWILLANDGAPLGIQRKGWLHFEQTHFPMIHCDFEHEEFTDLARQFQYTIWTAVPHPGAHIALDPNGLEELAQGAKRLRESSDRAIIGLFGGNLFEVPQYLCRTDVYLSNLMMYPEAAHRLSEKLCELYIQNLEKWLKAVGPFIDVVLFGDDLGGQQGPLISPATYREFYKPYHRRLWRKVRELANVKIMLHSCGGIEPFLDDLIDVGLEAVNPVQISCPCMETGYLKRKYGDRLCLWGGGCDTQRILQFGTRDDIRRHVKRQIEILNPGGGFVFQQVHNILATVPPENILTMFEATRLP